MRASTTHIIIHTAAWPGDPSSAEIRRVHVEENGWDDIGYHYIIRKNGTVEQGRPELNRGAHCVDMGMNSCSIGICLSGHHDQEYLKSDQLNALLNLCRSLMDFYSVPLKNILGHRETGAVKTCPGNLIDMDWLRNKISG